jgi:hypothetical protein
MAISSCDRVPTTSLYKKEKLWVHYPFSRVSTMFGQQKKNTGKQKRKDWVSPRAGVRRKIVIAA